MLVKYVVRKTGRLTDELARTNTVIKSSFLPSLMGQFNFYDFLRL